MEIINTDSLHWPRKYGPEIVSSGISAYMYMKVKRRFDVDFSIEVEGMNAISSHRRRTAQWHIYMKLAPSLQKIDEDKHCEHLSIEKLLIFNDK